MAHRRNLLILLAHGLRSDALSDDRSCDDRSWPLHTPNLERIAQHGLRLVATSACPDDPGGMVSLLSGLHPRQHGLLRAEGCVPLAQALPRWLSESGYHVTGVGCVGPIAHLLDDPVTVADVGAVQPEGCAYWAAMQDKGLAAALGEQRRQRLRAGPFEPETLMLDPEDDIDGFIARQAEARLETMPDDRPWALFVVFSGPGNDLPPPTLYEAVVDRVELQRGFMLADLKTLDALAEPAWPRIMLQRLEPAMLGRIRADYLGRVSLLDYSVGRLMKVAHRRADRDRTWTLVTSDRGHLLGEHGLIGPRSFLAGAVEVPVLLAPPPGTPERADHTADGLVSHVDVTATLAALGGCDLPAGAVGRSMLPLLGADPVLPTPAGGNVSEFGDRLLLETERFKAIFKRSTRQCLGLYDLLNDPDERSNLIGSARGANLVDALRWRIADALMPLRAVAGVFEMR